MILATTFVYNERQYIEQWVKYYQSQNCELFILDNMSNDGTYEYLVDNNIPCKRIDTNESFHLHILQEVLVKEIHRIKPDWVIYNGADLFTIVNGRLDNYLKKIDRFGYNQLQLPCINVLNTGEEFRTPLQEYYKYGQLYRNLILSAKYGKDFFIKNDHIGVKDSKPYNGQGYLVNYGGCKPASEQDEKLKRREKAWKEGLPNNVGKHFRAGKAKQWLYDRNSCIDLSQQEYWKYIKKTICM